MILLLDLQGGREEGEQKDGRGREPAFTRARRFWEDHQASEVNVHMLRVSGVIEDHESIFRGQSQAQSYLQDG